MSESRVLVCGNLNVETSVSVAGLPLAYVPSSARPWSVTQRPAGVGFNLARALVRQGVQVAFASLVATDLLSRLLRLEVEWVGLSTESLCPALSSTPQSVVLVAPDDQRQILTDLKDMATAVYPLPTFKKAVRGAAMALMTNAPFVPPLLPLARAARVPILTDLHAVERLDNPYDRPFLEAADLLFASAERWTGDPLDLARGLLERSRARLVVLGCGEQGAVLLERGGLPVHVAAHFAGQVVNTTGAGDVLAATFAAGWLESRLPTEALRMACAKAGRHVAGLELIA